MNRTKLRALLLALAVSVALIVGGCAGPKAKAAGETRIAHLVAEEITLVDKDGKPWLRIGAPDPTGFRGMEILADKGDATLTIGIGQEHMSNSTGDQSTEPIPLIQLQSANGDGVASLYCHDTGAAIAFSRADETEIQVGVEGDKAWIRTWPCLSFGDKENPPANLSAAAREFALQYSADKLLLIVTAADGTKKEIDLRALIQ